jgi:hypothetical protein
MFMLSNQHQRCVTSSTIVQPRKLFIGSSNDADANARRSVSDVFVFTFNDVRDVLLCVFWLVCCHRRRLQHQRHLGRMPMCVFACMCRRVSDALFADQ